ncbi:RNA polymerase sigma factor [Algoriphagus halophytocola]|uniref:RNA polymerase sigma factor n=1 Tax=Algoriphagus halophytocola TaxID=2991499 RepID=UPI0029F56787|nr:sigma-70 family RNA polymerase sigma factor [Algoriphagus sp. TR-M5]
MEKADQLSLQALVREISQGNEHSFERLYQIFSKKVYHTSRKMKLNHEEAEEVVQEVFLQIWNYRKKLDPDLSINAYMIAIIRSLVVKKKQKEARFFAFQQYQIPISHAMSSQAADEEMIFEEYHRISMEILEKLPPAQKQIFELRHLENKSVEEISEHLNLSPRTVENQVFRATKSFKENLGKLEIVSVTTSYIVVKDLFDYLLHNC